MRSISLSEVHPGVVSGYVLVLAAMDQTKTYSFCGAPGGRKTAKPAETNPKKPGQHRKHTQKLYVGCFHKTNIQKNSKTKQTLATHIFQSRQYTFQDKFCEQRNKFTSISFQN